jgi:hypothetical protein
MNLRRAQIIIEQVRDCDGQKIPNNRKQTPNRPKRKKDEAVYTLIQHEIYIAASCMRETNNTSGCFVRWNK